MLVKISVFLNRDLKELAQVYLAEQDEENEIQDVKKATFLLRQFDLPGLRDLGLTETAADLNHVADRVKEFFGYDSIYDYAEEIPVPINSEVDRGLSDRMRHLWVRAVHKQFSEVNNPHSFKPDQVQELAKQIRPFTTDVETGFLRFARRLFQLGVTVIVESYVKNSAVYGATMLVDGKPCIVVTDREERYDLLWRTLAHELVHVIAHLSKIRNRTYHLSGDPSLFDEGIEEQADRFAAEFLVPKEVRDRVRPHIHTPAVVRRVARSQEVHPSIIYGLYLDWDLKRDNSVSSDFRSKEHAKLRDEYYLESQIALNKFHHFDKSTWTRPTLDETVPLIEETLNPDGRTQTNQMA
jgi:Zn-dependent peptidase ImmA (M78 family)